MEQQSSFDSNRNSAGYNLYTKEERDRFAKELKTEKSKENTKIVEDMLNRKFDAK